MKEEYNFPSLMDQDEPKGGYAGGDMIGGRK